MRASNCDANETEVCEDHFERRPGTITLKESSVIIVVSMIHRSASGNRHRESSSALSLRGVIMLEVAVVARTRIHHLSVSLLALEMIDGVQYLRF